MSRGHRRPHRSTPRSDHAEIGDERGERVVGDLGAGGAHARDEGGLADAGEPDERRVGHELHLELDPVLDGRLALLGKGGGAARRGHEMRISQAARSAGRHHDALAVVREVGDLVTQLHGGAVSSRITVTHGDL